MRNDEPSVSHHARTVELMTRTTSPSESSSLDPRQERAAWKALVSELPSSLRALRSAVLVETLANGVPVNPAAVTAVLTSHDERVDEPTVWLRSDVEELLWIGIDEFCDALGLSLPPGCPRALHAILAVGSTTSAFAPESDSATELFAPLRELGHLV